MMDDQFCLEGTNFQNDLVAAAKAVKGISYFNDVTLACDDGEILANKFVLFSSSEFFQSLFSRLSQQSPYIFLKNTKLQHLKAVIDFMYEGQVCVNRMDVQSVLHVARDLKIESMKEQQIVPDPLDNIHDVGSTLKVEIMGDQENLTEDYPNEITEIPTVDAVNKLNLSLANMDRSSDHQESKHSLDVKALEMMEKKTTESGKVIWQCKFCGKDTNDKTRLRKHVISRHIRNLEKVLEEKGEISEEAFYNIAQGNDLNISQFDNDDLKAVLMMKLTKDSYGRNVWSCNLCDNKCNDKTRVRKHIKSRHLKLETVNLSTTL